MATHEVKIEIVGGVFNYDKPYLCVLLGDRIKWKLKNNFPYGIIIKAPFTPLNWRFKAARKGMWITATVSLNAMPGHYPYGVGAFNGSSILFDDPVIIVRDPSNP